MTTFAYWLCTVEREAEFPAIGELASAMTTQCDLEEQLSESAAFDQIHALTPSPLKPLAPVTLTKQWSPFPAACEILGAPINRDSIRDQHQACAFAIWKPTWLGDLATNNFTRDESHFRYLLRLASVKADQLGRDIFVLGKIGWSYDGELESPTNPEVALAMLEYGFVYTDRVPR